MVRRRTGTRSRWALLAGAAVLFAATAVCTVSAGCGTSGGTGPRALTGDEANRLALARFRNYQAGGRAVTITVPDPAGGVVVTGTVDYRAKLGYGVLRGRERDAASSGLVEWSASTVLVNPAPDPPAQAPPTPPVTGWFNRPLRTSGSTLDSALGIVLGLGSDRPDNAQLLPQNGASWLGTDRIAGQQVDVLAGPAARAKPGTAGTVHYWLGQDGTLYRIEATVASERQPVVVDFGAATRVAVQPVPGITPTR